MSNDFFLKGLVIGFSIAAPVGPIGILCIRRTLIQGRISGLISGLGAATADGFYGFTAAFGLTYIANFLLSQQRLIHLFGGIFLLYLGWSTFHSPPAEKPALAEEKGLLGNYLSTFFLTLTNPATIISFGAIFAGVGLSSAEGDYAAASSLVLGVFLGSVLWWFLLSGGINFFHSKINKQGLHWINKISGLLISLLGLFALYGIISL